MNIINTPMNADTARLIGTIVKFPHATLHGMGKQAGTVLRVLEDGRLEIRAQLGGYYVVREGDLIR